MLLAITENTFHFITVTLTPFKEKEDASSKRILKDIINLMLELRNKESKSFLIDRLRNQSTSKKRELFMSNIKVLGPDRVLCKMVLLREGKKPRVKPKDVYETKPLELLLKGDIVEETFFVIDYSLGFPLLCVEFENHGPRISDIIYYLRQIALKNRLAKAVKYDIHMKQDLDHVLKNIGEVLSLVVKANPKSLSNIDSLTSNNYFSGFNLLDQKVHPEAIRVKLYFQPKAKTQRISLEPPLKMVRELLNKFKINNDYVDYFQDFVVEYNDTDGEFDTFNLLNGKHEIIKEFDPDALANVSEWHKEIKDELDEYINKRENP